MIEFIKRNLKFIIVGILIYILTLLIILTPLSEKPETYEEKQNPETVEIMGGEEPMKIEIK